MAAAVLVAVSCRAFCDAGRPEGSGGNPWAAAALEAEAEALRLPEAGDWKLRILSPEWIEMERVTTKAPESPQPEVWDFADPAQRLKPEDFVVRVEGEVVPVTGVSFRRRPLYARMRSRDLRIGNWLSLRLGKPVGEGSEVRVEVKRGGVIFPGEDWRARAAPWRYSPVIHVNQDVYPTGQTKRAYVGWFLGTAGELEVGERKWSLVDLADGRAVLGGRLRPRGDSGFPVPHYQKVMEAGFSGLRSEGRYVLAVEGLGASLPFWISRGGAGLIARILALGLYHQRCGEPGIGLPFTRFAHGPCHTRPAEVPSSNSAINAFLRESTAGVEKDAAHTAPRLGSVEDGLYPIARSGEVDVSGGHHDAGDYSKYTINSASMIHALVFAVDSLPGVGGLDNLGIPESGDGISDLLQIAVWEADFLVKMQDEDGGFFFLVYPRGRKYENDVLPDHGDLQTVYPKNTAASAAACAALAQAGSSPFLRSWDTRRADRYLAAAKTGWDFVLRTLEEHGWAGSYQKITHYGDLFRHDDEILWAAVEAALAWGDPSALKILEERFRPASAEWRRWGWLRLPEAYGNAIRSAAFGRLSGRRGLPAWMEEEARREALAAAEDALAAAEASAYGISFPLESKRHMEAGWFFASDAAFDLAVGWVLGREPGMLEAMDTNFGYDAGANPVNVPRITGLGARRQREIVSQHAQNSWRALPPSGLLTGSVVSGFMWFEPYGRELGGLVFPPDAPGPESWPLYDRWGDSFNTRGEAVVVNQARALAASALRMAAEPDAPWKPEAAAILGVPRVMRAGEEARAVLASPLQGTRQRVVWDLGGQQPLTGASCVFVAPERGEGRLEAEAYDPEGRRVFASVRTRIACGAGGAPAVPGPSTMLLLDFDEDTARPPVSLVEKEGAFFRDGGEVFWMDEPAGFSLRFPGLEGRIVLEAGRWPAGGVRVRARLRIERTPHGRRTAPLLVLRAGGKEYGLRQLKWQPKDAPGWPLVGAAGEIVAGPARMAGLLLPESWHLLVMEFGHAGARAAVDGEWAGERATVSLPAPGTRLRLEIGSFAGWVDDVVVEELEAPAGASRAERALRN